MINEEDNGFVAPEIKEKIVKTLTKSYNNVNNVDIESAVRGSLKHFHMSEHEVSYRGLVAYTLEDILDCDPLTVRDVVSGLSDKEITGEDDESIVSSAASLVEHYKRSLEYQINKFSSEGKQ